MKATKYLAAMTTAATLAAVSLNSCTLETSSAGKFDGMWHLTRVDTIATGGVLDLSEQRIFWSFQFKLMQAEDKNGVERTVLMRYSKGDGTLTLSSPYAYDRDNGDEPLSSPALLKPFGINETEEEFQVNSINGSKMQLQSKTLKLSFKKF